MTPTRKSRWSYPLTMCFAPRYTSGPIARPCSPARNTASLAETPCPSSPTQPMPNSSAVSAAVAIVRLLPFIFCMAGVTRCIEVTARCQDAVGILRLGRLEGRLARVDECARHLDPVAFVEGAAAQQEQVTGLDERCRAVADDSPLLVVPGSNFLHAFGGARRPHRLVDHIGGGHDDAVHDLLDAGNRRRDRSVNRRRRTHRPRAGDDETHTADEQRDAHDEKPVHSSHSRRIVACTRAPSRRTP